MLLFQTPVQVPAEEPKPEKKGEAPKLNEKVRNILNKYLLKEQVQKIEQDSSLVRHLNAMTPEQIAKLEDELRNRHPTVRTFSNNTLRNYLEYNLRQEIINSFSLKLEEDDKEEDDKSTFNNLSLGELNDLYAELKANKSDPSKINNIVKKYLLRHKAVKKVVDEKKDDAQKKEEKEKKDDAQKKEEKEKKEGELVSKAEANGLIPKYNYKGEITGMETPPIKNYEDLKKFLKGSYLNITGIVEEGKNVLGAEFLEHLNEAGWSELSKRINDAVAKLFKEGKKYGGLEELRAVLEAAVKGAISTFCEDLVFKKEFQSSYLPANLYFIEPIEVEGERKELRKDAGIIKVDEVLKIRTLPPIRINKADYLKELGESLNKAKKAGLDEKNSKEYKELLNLYNQIKDNEAFDKQIKKKEAKDSLDKQVDKAINAIEEAIKKKKEAEEKSKQTPPYGFDMTPAEKKWITKR
ncbi:MAG: hypothetical protein N3E51_04615 [Candidatus Micrarchaeota archaeon]|nr:hypothetical protein [Candidatus Micrarchaeota archaeon]